MLNFLTYLPHTGTRWQDFLSSGEESRWACLYLDIISRPSDDINCKITDPWHMSVWRQESLAHWHTEHAVLQPSIFIYNLPIWSSTRLEDLPPEATSVQPKYPEEETCQEGNWEILGSALLPCPFLSIGRAVPIVSHAVLGRGSARGTLLRGPFQFLRIFACLNSALPSFCISCPQNHLVPQVFYFP